MKSLVLIFVCLIGSISCQVPTAETPAPTGPTTTTTTTQPSETTETVTLVPPETTTTTTATIPTASTTTTTTTQAVTTTTTTETRPTPPPSSCPSTGTAFLPTNICQEFTACINGWPYPGRCPDGTLWCTARRACHAAHTVDCGSRIRSHS